MDQRLTIRRWAAWAPGLETPDDWRAWALGGKSPTQSGDWPALSHLEPMFKRRLSQLSRMILQVGHEVTRGIGNARVVFASHYGEINQQYKISRSLIDSGEVAPAAFSLSVFNTPSALLSIAEKNHGYASASYGGPDAFGVALLEAMSLLHAEPSQPVVLVLGDELLPADYESLVPGRNQPYALACLLATGGEGERLDISFQNGGDGKWRPDGKAATALEFLAWFLSETTTEYRYQSREADWVFKRVEK